MNWKVTAARHLHDHKKMCIITSIKHTLKKKLSYTANCPQLEQI